MATFMKWNLVALLLFALKSGFLHSARDKAVIVALAPDAHMHSFLASAFLCIFLAPFALIESQHIGVPLSSNWPKPFNSSGQFARAFAEARAFFFGCMVLGVAGFSAPSSIVELAEALADELGRGRRCKLMRGSCINCTINKSNGNSPLGPLVNGPLCSWDIKVKSSLSARKSCSIVTLAYPLGDSRVSCMSRLCTHLSWMSFDISLHWSNAKPRRCSAHCNKISFEVSALILGSPAASFNVCCSTVKVVGFSFKLCCTSESLLVHLLGGTQTIEPLSWMPAIRSIRA